MDYNILGKLYSDLAREHNSFAELVFYYSSNFLIALFVIIFILSLIRSNNQILKKIFMLSCFTFGAVLFNSHVFPYFVFNEKCFYCGRLHGFFNSANPYIALILVFIGAYLSHMIKDDSPGSLSIEKKSFYLYLNYAIAFLHGLLFYIPLMIYLLVINSILYYILFFNHYIDNVYIYMLINCTQYGLYTGWMTDKLIHNHKFTSIYKFIECFIICFISSLYILLYGLIYHVNEGTK